MLNRTPSSCSTFFRLTPAFLTARLKAHSYRVDRGLIILAVYVALVVLGMAILHKLAATSGSVMPLADAPELPIDITEAFDAAPSAR